MKPKKYISLFLISLCIFSAGMVARIETAYKGAIQVKERAKQVEEINQQKIDSLTQLIANSCCN